MQTPARHLAAFILAAFLLPVAAFAESANFIISQHGNPVGTASFQFTPTPDGLDSTSLVRVDMKSLNYALSKSEELTDSSQLRHVLLSAIVNGSAINVNAAPDPAPESAQFLINISAGGRTSTTRLPAHNFAIFLPDFDPGALQTLLALAAADNNRDLWAIVPRQAGLLQPIQLATYADESGTLDGNPVTVHHLVCTVGDAVTDIFSGPENQLLQAELPQQGFAMVRRGFVLTPPAKPGAPPAE